MPPAVTPNFDVTHEALGADLSEGFHLLRARRRRQVIWYISGMETDDTVTVRELSKQIASVEQGVPPGEVLNPDYRTVYTNLVQNHLPELAGAGVIEYDSDRQVVAPGPNIRALSTLAGIAIPTIILLRSENLAD